MSHEDRSRQPQQFPAPTGSAPTAEDEARLDQAAAAVRSDEPTASDVTAALDRARLALATAARTPPAPCAAFVRDLPALGAGTLEPARAVLVADHCRECVSCRRALHALRAPGPVAPRAEGAQQRRGHRWTLPAAAAALLVVAAAGLLWSSRRPAGPDVVARIGRVDGDLLTTSARGVARVTTGAEVAQGQSLRTAAHARAILELPDGTRVEMNERSALSLEATGDSMTILLARGDIIVEAARRPERNLFVQTDDCRAAVKGTVFTVEHGIKGSRVGVLEGEVHVDRPGQTLAVLGPGQQVTTRTSLTDRSLDDQVAWSARADIYKALLHEVDAVARQVAAETSGRRVRHSETLLGALPASTVLHAALPNAGGVARFASLLDERLSTAPALAQWWREEADEAEDRDAPSLHDVLGTVGEVSAALGDEVVVALCLVTSPNGRRQPVPVVVAPVRDEAILRNLLARVRSGEAEASGTSPVEGLLDDRALRSRAAAGANRSLVVALSSGHVLAGPDPALLVAVADGLAAPARAGADRASLGSAVLEQIDAGAELIVAVDVGGLVELAATETDRRGEGDRPEADAWLRGLGLTEMDRFVLSAGGPTDGQAVLSFNEARRGLASWLGEPAPMGSLRFISPAASAVFAAVIRDPAHMVADIEALVGKAELAARVEELEREAGIDLYADVAAPLGGEVAVALDGSLLPTLAWKVVVEVYDEERLQRTVERLVEAANQPPQDGSADPSALTLRLDVAQTAEGPVRSITSPGSPLGVHYAFRDGYLVVAPRQSLVVGALQGARLGASITTSADFNALLPQDDEGDLSLLAYENAATLLGSLPIDVVAALGLQEGASERDTAGLACLVHGRADSRRITFGISSPAGAAGGGLPDMLRNAWLRALIADLARRAAPATGPAHDPVSYDAPSRQEADVHLQPAASR